MDYLPTFKNAIPYPQVPYLGLGVLPPSPFHDYPQASGWDLGGLQMGDIAQGHDDRPTAAFLQDWLYFGLLSELSSIACKKAPIMQDFVVGNGGLNRIVIGGKLEGKLEDCISCIGKMRLKKRLQAVERLECALDTASRIVTHLWYSSVGGAGNNNRRDHVPVDVLTSIMVLGSSIDAGLIQLALATRKRSWRLAEMAHMSMGRKGWCPRDAAVTKSSLSEVSMYCASHLQRHHRQDGGSVSTAAPRHDHCTDYACDLQQIDDDAYETEHVTDHCPCEFWSVDEKELVKIIQENRIPYIELKLESSKSEKDGQKRKLVPSLGSFNNSINRGLTNWLVIFSHVWADGLGNKKKNALPMCQLQRFYDMLEDSPWLDVTLRQALDRQDILRRFKDRQMKSSLSIPPRSFRRWNRKTFNRSIKIWIDTLCVPVSKEEGEARDTAITMLKRYYSYAAMTVVLDKSLYSLPRKAYSESELLLRIGLSSWMSRCWTMQEAVIAGGSLSVRFADGWLPLLDMVGFIRQKSLIISKNVMDDGQRTKIKRYNLLAGIVCFPLIIGGILINPLLFFGSKVQEVLVYMLCNMLATKKRTGSKKDRNKVPLTASERLSDDANQFFASIGTLSQHSRLTSLLGDKTKSSPEGIHRIVLSWHSLRYRNTSHQSDRFINFAFACARDDKDFDAMRNILQLSKKDRLRSWYLAQGALPSGLLFLEGAKINVPGFRWAPADIHPASIDDESPSSCLTTYSSGLGAEGSLRLEKPALMLEQQPAQSTVNTWHVVDRGSGFRYVVSLDWRSSANPDSQQTIFQGSLAIILSRAPEPQLTTSAAVVENVATVAKQNSGNFVCRALVSMQPQGTNGGGPAVVLASQARIGTWVVS